MLGLTTRRFKSKDIYPPVTLKMVAIKESISARVEMSDDLFDEIFVYLFYDCVCDYVMEYTFRSGMCLGCMWRVDTEPLRVGWTPKLSFYDVNSDETGRYVVLKHVPDL